jgi:hypothetical protein
VKVRVAIPAANPPDNAIDLTSPTFCRASHLRTSENLMSQRKGPRCNGLGSCGYNSWHAGWLGCHRREVGVTHG